MPKQLTLTKQRILSRIQIEPNGCWIWQGAKYRTGYGAIHVRALSAAPIQAHRAAAFLWNGVPLDPTIVVRHQCDNPPCVNPAHLHAGTTVDNIRDCVLKGRHRSGFNSPGYVNPNKVKTHCKRGHPFTPENTRITNTGGRACLACQDIYNRERYEKVRLSRCSA